MRYHPLISLFVVLLSFFVLSTQGQMKTIQERYAQAYQDFNSGNFESSAKLFEGIIKEVPHVMQAYLHYGTVLEAMGRISDAKTNYQTAISKFKKDIEPTRALCRLYFNELQKDKKNELYKMQSEFACEETVKKSKGDPQDYLVLGGVYLNAEKGEESAQALRKAYAKAKKDWENFPHQRELLRIKAQAEFRAGNCKLAVKATKELLEVESNSQLSICNLGHILSSCESSDEAVQAMRDCFSCKEETGLCDFHVPDFETCGHYQMKYCGPRWDLCSSPNVEKVTIISDADDTKVFGREEGPLTLFPPKPPTPMNYNEKRTFIVHLKDVYMRDEAGAMHTDCYVFSGGHSFDAKIPDSYPKDLPTIYINEPVINMVSQTNNNYYHFVAEGLSRLFLGLKYIPDAKNLKVLVPGNNRFILEIVTLLKLENRIVVYNVKQNERYFFKDLYFADWTQLNLETHQYNAWAIYQPPQLGFKAVREGILPHIKKTKPTKPQIVYVGRSDLMSSRHVNGEKELLEEIRTNFPSYEVVSYSGSKHGIVEQAETFHLASVVIGPHGAGLTNIMFCQEKTPIIYFPMKPNVDFNFAYMASAVDLDFWSVNTVTSSFHGQYHLNPELISDIIKTLKEALPIENNDNNDNNKSEL